MHAATTIRVKMNEMKSDYFETSCGVPQGDGLSPLLFNIVVDFVLQKVSKNPNLLRIGCYKSEFGYADDIALASGITI